MLPSAIGAIAVLAGTVYFALHHFSVWWGRRSARLHLWICGWCVASTAAELGRLIHYTANDSATAVLGMRIATVSAFPIGVLLIGVTHALAGERRIRWLIGALATGATILTMFGLFTNYIVTDVTRYWVDGIGQRYIWVVPGTAMPLLAVYGLGLLAYSIWVIWRSAEARSTRGMFILGALIYVATGINDLLIAAGLSKSVVLFEYAFISFAVVFDHVSVRQIQRMYQALEQEVEVHNQDAHEANQRLRLALHDAETAGTEKDQFLANISHEIRTPMNGVIGTAELLGETELSEEQADYVRILRDSGDAMLAIVNDILDFSKLVAGRVELERVEFNLWQQVEEVVHLYASRAYAKNIEISLQIDRNVPFMVFGDPGRYRQVVVNLVSNAIKFTLKGEVRLHLTCDASDTDTVVVRCAVADTGIGLNQLQLEKVFEPFAQADASTTRRHGGTGLGLPICQQLAHAMGGQVDGRRNPSEGMTFSFSAMLGKIHPQQSASSLSVETTALVVSECPSIAAMLTYQLESVDAKVVQATADSAQASAEAIPRSAHAVVFLDSDLLDTPGRVALRGALPERARLYLLHPIGDSTRDKPAGVDGVISKPTRRTRIVEALNGSESTSQQRQEQRAKVVNLGRVLIAEDNAVNQLVASKMLESLGFVVDVANDGAGALAEAQQRRYDIIFMDCQMPEVDGYDATRAIRAKAGPNQATPIVALTANARTEDQLHCLQAGMTHFMPKPVNLNALRKIVQHCITSSPQS